MRGTRDRGGEVREKKLRTLRIIEKYFLQGRATEVYRITDPLISRRSLWGWRKNKEKALVGHKSNELLRIAELLPDPRSNTTAQVYAFAMRELGLDAVSQTDLPKYSGRYSLRHRMTASGLIGLDNLEIRVSDAPRFGVFLVRYKLLGRGRYCDGLVLLRGSRVYLLGLSRSAMFFALLNSVDLPSRRLIKGFGVFENIEDGEMQHSNIVLHQVPTGSLTEEEKTAIEEHLDGGR